ncbi:hypothetical protein BDA99DRAFT_516234 [Phascolomyces articulosus]|uniref:Uncharacterized protein n=1 Tax=Phascolomyces articulosus TaxID=60185 RepID=A0AAD5PBV8_9FUNG|nr:hypothetical protein BDA99DRAFT_516234 [Phascolomyces articulosus]
MKPRSLLFFYFLVRHDSINKCLKGRKEGYMVLLFSIIAVIVIGSKYSNNNKKLSTISYTY